MRRVITLLIMLAGLATQPAWAAQPAGQPYRIAFGNRFVTQVMIDGQGPFSFIIDTASSRTLIYEHVRKQLSLTKSQPDDITVYGINGTAKALPVKPAVLAVADKEIRGLTLGVLPPGAMAPPGVDGILGIDVLSRYFVVLDRTAMRLILLAPGSEATRRYRDWSSVALTPRPLKNIPIDFWYMNARIGPAHFAGSFGPGRSSTLLNPIHFTTLFDLGAGITMVNWPAAEQMGVHEKDFHLPEDIQNLLRDAFGTDEPAVKLEQMTITLDHHGWRDQIILVVNSDVFTRFNLDTRPAMIAGAGLFHNNSLAIDFAGHQLFIGPAVHQTPKS